MKPEIRNQKPESIPNDESRIVGPHIRHSGFGFDSEFWFRVSNFRPPSIAFTRNSQPATRNSGFTLIELMISLALVLILIVGINFVFRSATDAVGAGQALNQINSDAQSTQPVLFNDLNNVAKPPPLFIISSQFVTQFLNADDAKTSSDPNVIPIDNAGNYAFIDALQKPPTYLSTAPQQYISLATLNSRNHRADLLKFIAHYLYPRRSGPDGTFFSPDSSNDAYVEIGHAALPTLDQSAYYGPSELPAGNSGYDSYVDQLTPATPTPGVPRIGAFASDWVLSRRLTLMKDPTTITQGPPTAPTGNDYYYAYNARYPHGIYNANGNYIPNLTPLSYGTVDNNPTDNPTGGAQPSYLFQSSRYDLAGITPENFDRTCIDTAILNWQNTGAYAGASLWWNPLVYTWPFTQNTATPPTILSITPPPYTCQFYSASPQYSGYPASPSAANSDPGQWYARTQCNPTIQNPVTAASLAQMAPYFLQHCSQFIVEYAGDFMQQDPATGKMTGIGPDGQIDYYLDANGNKHIRWYGMPRSSTGVPHPGDKSGAMVLIRGFNPSNPIPQGVDDISYSDGTLSGTPLNYFTDVIPLRDYYTAYQIALLGAITTPAYGCPPWEVDVNFSCARDYGSYGTPLPSPITYATYTFVNGVLTKGNSFNLVAFGDPQNPPRYVAAWHDDMPALIRILIKVDDPNNKVKDGPWYEYIFKLK
jgi:prepilin-type N-terminal cleavage/methylation domain-containing protein